MDDTADRQSQRMPTGVAGLDDILAGGLIARHMYLIEGAPGTGKTTLGLQFLLEGVARGESGLYVTISERKEELCASAESHGWSLDAVSIFELTGIEGTIGPDSEYVMFHPAEVELSVVTKTILEEVEKMKSVRVVLDSMSELRLLAQDPLRYRRQVLALKQFFVERGSTVLLLDESRAGEPDLQIHSLAHGVIELEQLAPDYGGERRRLRILKMRGMHYRDGYHDFRIVRGGLEVYPRLVAQEHFKDYRREAAPSGLEGLDALLGGGLDRGISAILMGPAGSGKSSIAGQFAFNAAARGGRAAIFTFDESRATYLARSAGIGMDLREHLADGRLILQQIDPAELSPGEFSHRIRRAVEGGVHLLVIDSLNGYMNAMSEERHLVLHLHELLSYLGQQGVTTLLLLELQGLGRAAADESLSTSNLADAVILLHYFQSGGELRKAVSVIKKRTGGHERTIHELFIRSSGLSLATLALDIEILNDVPVLHEQ